MTTYAIPRFADLVVKAMPARPINLTETIINLLAEEPRTVLALADMLGCAPNTIGARLRRLEATRQAHRARIVGKKGMHYLWHSGPADRAVYPLPLEPEPVIELDDDAPGAGQPNRTFTSVYTIDTPRDPIIAALFGPARKESA